jgi:uncharacterized protein YkwD
MIHAFVLGIALYGASVDVTAERAMLADVNATRARAGVPALTLDPRLTQVALGHAMDMA